MSKLERADKEVGQGNTIVSAGAYKDAEDKTRYKFGIRCNVPSKAEMGEELADKFFQLGVHRAMSVDAAGSFNKANEFGTLEEAQAFSERWSNVAGCASAFEKARREGGAARVDSTETLAVKYLANVLKQKQADGKIAGAKDTVPRADDPPKTEKGAINYVAWAKVLKEAEHPWYAVSYKKVAPSEKGFE
jgi:hypothetical protein